MTKWVDENNLRDGERERISRASAFQPTIELSPKSGLPEIAITEAVRDNMTGRYLGREYFDVYPRGYLLPGESWAGPNVAFKYACSYLNEAMSLEDPKFKEIRNECIKSAELLYLHSTFGSIWKKTSEAYRKLGFIYMFDLGCGSYWMINDDHVPLNSYPKILQIDDYEKRAHYCLNKAIEMGDSPSKCLLGDLFKNGIGTKIDLKRAFNSYLESLKVEKNRSDLALGIANSRLGECFEFGLGTIVNYNDAKKHYLRAIKQLDVALDSGEDYFEYEFVNAQKSFERVKQEIFDNKSERIGYEYSYRKRRYCD